MVSKEEVRIVSHFLALLANAVGGAGGALCGREVVLDGSNPPLPTIFRVSGFMDGFIAALQDDRGDPSGINDSDIPRITHEMMAAAIDKELEGTALLTQKHVRLEPVHTPNADAFLYYLRKFEHLITFRANTRNCSVEIYVRAFDHTRFPPQSVF